MLLPKKITPDNIREAVVEIKYISDLPYEVLVGIFFNALDRTFTYTNRPPQQPPLGQNLLAASGQEITLKIGVPSLFYNDKISIQLSPNTFVFTCLNQYIGWDDYKPQIVTALKQLMLTGHILKCIRVGLRYISEYPDKDVRELIKFNFSFGFPEIKSESIAFRSEFFYNGTKIILNLNNKVPFLKQNPFTKQPEVIKTSIIDIDVIAENLEVDGIDGLLKVIEENHTKEKEIYFSMLTDDFLKTLNPEY